MSDPRLAKWARVMAEYSVEIRPGDKVFIHTAPVATPLVLELVREILQRGGYPQFIIELPGVDETFLKYASDEQLKTEPPMLKKAIEEFDVRIRIYAATNTKALSNVDSRRLASYLAAQKMTPLFMRRQATGALRWCATLFPTEAYAQDADMSLREYEEFVFGAGLIDHPDPVAAWKEISARQQKLVEWLRGKRAFR